MGHVQVDDVEAERRQVWQHGRDPPEASPRPGEELVPGAEAGAEALDVMARANGEIGLVLLDLRMPVMDGFELCRRVEGSATPSHADAGRCDDCNP